MNVLTVVLTDFNGYAQTRRCLAALSASRCTDFGVVVVDHGTDGVTRAGLAAEYPHVTRLHGPADAWWAGACNLGIRHALEAGAGAIVLLNNDCYVQPDTLDVLEEAAARSPGAIVAAVQRDMATGRRTVGADSCLLLGFPTRPSRVPEGGSGTVSVPLVIGGRGVRIPADVFDTVGLFDEEQLPHYGADHDFYFRARRLGITLLVARDSIVDVDPERTSRASTPGALRVREFLETLRDPRSHRNLAAVRALFRKHYPLRGAHGVGLALYLCRYVLVYAYARCRHLLAGSASR